MSVLRTAGQMVVRVVRGFEGMVQFGFSPSGSTDWPEYRGVMLTPSEARLLAAELMRMADEICAPPKLAKPPKIERRPHPAYERYAARLTPHTDAILTAYAGRTTLTDLQYQHHVPLWAVKRFLQEHGIPVLNREDTTYRKMFPEALQWRQEIAARHAAGETYVAIATSLGISVGRVRELAKQARGGG